MHRSLKNKQQNTLSSFALGMLPIANLTAELKLRSVSNKCHSIAAKTALSLSKLLPFVPE